METPVLQNEEIAVDQKSEDQKSQEASAIEVMGSFVSHESVSDQESMTSQENIPSQDNQADQENVTVGENAVIGSEQCKQDQENHNQENVIGQDNLIVEENVTLAFPGEGSAQQNIETQDCVKDQERETDQENVTCQETIVCAEKCAGQESGSNGQESGPRILIGSENVQGQENDADQVEVISPENMPEEVKDQENISLESQTEQENMAGQATVADQENVLEQEQENVTGQVNAAGLENITQQENVSGPEKNQEKVTDTEIVTDTVQANETGQEGVADQECVTEFQSVPQEQAPSEPTEAESENPSGQQEDSPDQENVEEKVDDIVSEELKKSISANIKHLELRKTEIIQGQEDIKELQAVFDRHCYRTVHNLQQVLKDALKNIKKSSEVKFKQKLTVLGAAQKYVDEKIRDLKEFQLHGKGGAEENELPLTKEDLEKVLQYIPSVQIQPELSCQAVLEAINALELQFQTPEEALIGDLPPPKLEEGCERSIYVSSRLKNGTFWAVVAPEENVLSVLNQMNLLLRDKYIRDISWQTCEETNTQLVGGEFVYAQFPVDKKWYRARVVDASSVVTVVYLDYGNSHTVKRNQIILPEEDIFKECAYQAFECAIFEEAPTAPLSFDVRFAFNEMVVSAEVTAKFVKKISWNEERDTWFTELTVQDQDGVTCSVNAKVLEAFNREKKGQSNIGCRDVRLLENPALEVRAVVERPKTQTESGESTQRSAQEDAKPGDPVKEESEPSKADKEPGSKSVENELGPTEAVKQELGPTEDNKMELVPTEAVKQETRPTESGPQVAAREESAPTIKEESASAIKEESAPAIKEESVPVIKEESAPAIKEDSEPAIKEESASAIKEESAPRIVILQRPTRTESEPCVISGDKSASVGPVSGSVDETIVSQISSSDSAVSAIETPCDIDANTHVKTAASGDADTDTTVHTNALAPMNTDSSAHTNAPSPTNTDVSAHQNTDVSAHQNTDVSAHQNCDASAHMDTVPSVNGHTGEEASWRKMSTSSESSERNTASPGATGEGTEKKKRRKKSKKSRERYPEGEEGRSRSVSESEVADPVPAAEAPPVAQSIIHKINVIAVEPVDANGEFSVQRVLSDQEHMHHTQLEDFLQQNGHFCLREWHDGCGCNLVIALDSSTWKRAEVLADQGGKRRVNVRFLDTGRKALLPLAVLRLIEEAISPVVMALPPRAMWCTFPAWRMTKGLEEIRNDFKSLTQGKTLSLTVLDSLQEPHPVRLEDNSIDVGLKLVGEIAASHDHSTAFSPFQPVARNQYTAARSSPVDRGPRSSPVDRGPRSSPVDRTARRCFGCSETGHIAKECPQKQNRQDRDHRGNQRRSNRRQKNRGNPGEMLDDRITWEAGSKN